MDNTEFWVEDRLDTLTISFSTVVIMIFTFILLSVVDNYTFVGNPLFRILLSISLGGLIYYIMIQPKKYLKGKSNTKFLQYSMITKSKDRDKVVIPFKVIEEFKITPADEHISYFETGSTISEADLWRTELYIKWMEDEIEKSMSISGQSVNYTNFVAQLIKSQLLVQHDNSAGFTLNHQKIKM